MTPAASDPLSLIAGATGALCVGIGGGGDVAGAAALAELCRSLGTPARLGGTSWERRVVDPVPGPRSLAELTGCVAVHPAAALATADTRGPGGFRFAESRMAELLGEEVALADPGAGSEQVAEGLAAVAARLSCDLVLLIDVGGDALAQGDEPGLASPLCDAVMLAASAGLAARGVATLGVVLGAGCDGELTASEVLGRLAELAGAGGLLGAWGLTPPAVAELARAVAAVPTEASAQALECARGALGSVPIRGGRRSVERSPLGALAFLFDPAVALAGAAPLAAAVRDCADLGRARATLTALGVRSELDLEEEALEGASVQDVHAASPRL